MEGYVRNFIRSSLLWLGGGVVVGVWMAIAPGQSIAYRPAHVHANLLGFVSMMIFGVAYHVVPRFTGAPLSSRALAVLHLWVANAGLAGLVAGWMLRPTLLSTGTLILGAGALASAAGAFMFIVNLWRTLSREPRLRAL